MAVDSKVRRCSICKRHTLQHRNHNPITLGTLLLIIIFTVITGGLALILIIPAIIFNNVFDATKRWRCSICGGRKELISSSDINGIERSSERESKITPLKIISVTIFIFVVAGLVSNQDKVSTNPVSPPVTTAINAGQNKSEPLSINEELPDVEKVKVCRAAVAVFMDQPVEITTGKIDGSFVHAHYVQPVDSQRRDFQCKFEGDRVLWRRHTDGKWDRWIDKPSDPSMRYKIKGDMYTIQGVQNGIVVNTQVIKIESFVRQTREASLQQSMAVSSKPAMSVNDQIRVCRAAISALMAQPIGITSGSFSGGYTSVSYVRQTDKQKFEYQCMYDKDKVIWRTLFDDKWGRWRDDPSDSVVRYQLAGQEIVITESYGTSVQLEKRYSL